jgi:murein DD-endopeptidase MepM/ murein hydrolase activator NlpD
MKDAGGGLQSAGRTARMHARWLSGFVVCALAAGGCTAAGSERPGGGAPEAVAVAPQAAAAPPEVAVTPPVTPPSVREPDLSGFTFPIAGGCLPKSGKLMPNAPRTYRKGIHEGIDFYNSDNCTKIARGTEVLAAKAGRVLRADLSYVDVTQAQINAYLADPNTEASFDQFRGRQVWIDHGDGVVTRYCHLSGIAPGIVAGMTVIAGQLVGFVGESGTPSSVRKPGSEYHLHFELRVGGTYLGQHLAPAQVRALYVAAFSALRR